MIGKNKIDNACSEKIIFQIENCLIYLYYYFPHVKLNVLILFNLLILIFFPAQRSCSFGEFETLGADGEASPGAQAGDRRAVSRVQERG